MTLHRGRRVRAKVFFAIISILLFTECLIFGFYYLIEEYRSNKEMHKLARTTSILFEELVYARLKSSTHPDPDQLKRIGEIFIKIQKVDPGLQLGWLEDGTGKVLVQGSPGPVPSGKFRYQQTIGKMRVFYGETDHGYRVNKVEIPIVLEDKSVVYFKVFVRSMFRLERQDILFLLVLLGVAFTIGPVALFVSRFVTRRLKVISAFADRVMEGDTSARLEIESNDELSEIAEIFNGMLDSMDRMIQGTRELAANISHELRTPLTRVLLSRELMEDHLDNYRRDLFAKHLGYIEKDVERMNEMISRILLLSRLDIQPVLSAPEEIDFKILFAEILESFESVLNSGKYDFQGSYGDEQESGFLIVGQRDDLTIAISNLIENAIKYTPEHGNIAYGFHAGPDSLVLILKNSIVPGSLSEGDQEELFEPFYRSGQSKKHGSGLGMAISAKVIRAVGGDITASVSGDIFSIRIVFSQRQ